MPPCSVSVIIPAYRAAGTIGRALDSLCGQTRPPEEIVIVDDGSPDDIAAAVRPYGDRVTLLRKANGGAASARNLGIDRSRGDLVAFLDADDYWEPAKLERQLRVLERHPEVGLVASRFFEQRPGRPRVEVGTNPAEFLGRVLAVSGGVAFDVASQIWTSTVIIRRGAFGGNRFDTGLRTAEDRDLWLRVLRAAPAYILPDRLATAVLEPGSLSRSDVNEDYLNMLAVIHRYRDLFGSREVRTRETSLFRHWAGAHLANGQPRAALLPARWRLRRQPFSPEAWWVLLKSAALAWALGKAPPAPGRPGPGPRARLAEDSLSGS